MMPPDVRAIGACVRALYAPEVTPQQRRAAGAYLYRRLTEPDDTVAGALIAAFTELARRTK